MNGKPLYYILRRMEGDIKYNNDLKIQLKYDGTSHELESIVYTILFLCMR